MTSAPKTHDLIVIEGENDKSVAAARAIIEDLAAKPEVHEMLLKAKARHHKPLRFSVGPWHEVAQYDPSDNTVHVDLKQAETAMCLGEDGQQIKATLEAMVAHEIYHAGDEDHREQAGMYRGKLQYIQAQMMPQIDFESYKKRFDAVRTDKAKLAALVGEIYDEHIAPAMVDYSERYLAALRSDEFIMDYLRKYEEPAIRFSNGIVTTYYNQPGQNTDYLSTIKVDSMSREDFVGGLSEQLYQPSQSAVGESSSRGSKRTDPKPREGSWASNQ